MRSRPVRRVKSALKVCSWNISKGIIRKLADGEFLKSVCENDIICFNECLVKCPKEFELNGYEKNMCQEKNVTAVVLLCFIKNG